MNNTCAGCRYWKRDEQNKEKGRCEAPIPVSVWGIYLQGKTGADDGENCNSFRKRIVRAKRSNVTPISSAAPDFA